MDRELSENTFTLLVDYYRTCTVQTTSYSGVRTTVCVYLRTTQRQQYGSTSTLVLYSHATFFDLSRHAFSQISSFAQNQVGTSLYDSDLTNDAPMAENTCEIRRIGFTHPSKPYCTYSSV